MLTPSSLPRTLPAAIRDAAHKKLEVRVSAVRDLGRLAEHDGREQALQTLVSRLESDESPAVRAEAALALGDARARECLAALVSAARDENARVQQMALVALGEVATDEDQSARHVLEQSLEADVPELRFQALVALHNVAPACATPAVLRALEDEDAHIRYVALRIAEERWVRGSKEPLPDKVLRAAHSALKDEVADVRLAAALLLARAGDRSGAEVLVRAVETGSGAAEPEDAQAAIELCGELGLHEATHGLERRAWGLFGAARDPFAWQARVALARLGHDRAKLGILKGLRAWTRDARTLAVAAAGRARLSEARALIEEMHGDPERADPDSVDEALGLLASIEQAN
jgi:HEAT repeat protein